MESAAAVSRRILMTIIVVGACLFGYANANAVSSFAFAQSQEVEWGKGGELGSGAYVCKDWGRSYYVRCGIGETTTNYVMVVLSTMFVLPLFMRLATEPSFAEAGGALMLLIVGTAAWLLSGSQPDLSDRARLVRTSSLAHFSLALGVIVGFLFPLTQAI